MTATVVNINGHIFVGMLEVLAPVNAVHVAMTINIPADILNTIRESSLVVPPRILVKSANAPIKQSVNPSATHSIKMNFLLSSEISPKPFTTVLAAIIWAIPHPMVIIEPIYNKIFAITVQPISHAIFSAFSVFSVISAYYHT
jgi:hypothetical protein